MRILNRTGKAKGIQNIANIPEVIQYKYLGIELNQSLSLRGLKTRIKQKTTQLTEHIRKIRNTRLSPRARKFILKTIYIQMIAYG